MNSPRRDVAIEPRLHLFQNGAAVGVGLQPQDGYEHGLLKRSEHIRHLDYIVVIATRLSKPEQSLVA